MINFSWQPGLVSVVIPCHNAERFLAAAIRSALAQTYAPCEVIVVDDGSTDSSAAVAAAFGERVILIRQPHRGGNAARNAGIARSRGEYILFLDADDLLGPTCAASRVHILETRPEVGLVAGWYGEIDEAGRLLPRVPELRQVGALPAFRQVVRRNWGPPVGWMFRREAYDRCGGFDPLLRACQDWDFAVRLTVHYEVAYVPEVEAFYRKVAGSVSSDPARMLREARKLQRKNRAYAERRLQYRIDCAYGTFQLGRRVLYQVLTEGPRATALVRTARLVARHPSLLWVGPLAVLTWLGGKRPSARIEPPAGMTVPA